MKGVTAGPGFRCDECGAKDIPALVMVGQEPSFDSNTAWLCLSCAEEAACAIRATLTGEGE